MDPGVAQRGRLEGNGLRGRRPGLPAGGPRTARQIVLFSVGNPDNRFVAKDKAKYITDVDKSNFPCGVGNLLGNKGGVGISFWYHETSFCFVNCHLAAHQDMTDVRNKNVYDIVSGMKLKKGGHPQMDLANQFHHLFFLGDLNYRIDNAAQGLERSPSAAQFEAMTEDIMMRRFAELTSADQLLKEMHGEGALAVFEEGPIDFPPTFKVVVGDVMEFQPTRS
eukprot:670188_1